MRKVKFVKKHYISGSIRLVYRYIGDKMHGITREYYDDDGSIMCETSFHNNKLHGVHIGYLASGRVHFKRHWLGGKMHGKSERWTFGYDLPNNKMYYIYGEVATEEEWEKYKLITQLAKINE